MGGDLSSAELVGKLTAEPNSEWAEWRSGKPITQAQLARFFRPFGVAPCPVQIRDQQVRDIAVSNSSKASKGTFRSKTSF